VKARLVPVEEAVGMVIPHDITEIRPGEFKGPAFKKGHIIQESDIEHLRRLGKEHIYALELEEGEMHEDEAALRLARAVAGPGVSYSQEITEGKVSFWAARTGLFKVETESLYQLNLLGEIMLATRHTDFWVKKGEPVAAGRAIPLVVKTDLLCQVEEITQGKGIISVREPVIHRAGLVITGNEVYYGRVEDAFVPALRPKLASLGLEVLPPRFVPDDPELIRRGLEESFEAGADLVLVTGGMSVDPDDVTRQAVAQLGVEEFVYGSPVLPGAMFLIAYFKGRPILGVPACGMYFRTTVLDLVLPRVICGERLGRKDIARLGHGGFCLNCERCRFPVCPFGRG